MFPLILTAVSRDYNGGYYNPHKGTASRGNIPIHRIYRVFSGLGFLLCSFWEFDASFPEPNKAMNSTPNPKPLNLNSSVGNATRLPWSRNDIPSFGRGMLFWLQG